MTLLCALSACSDLGYYVDCARGHLSLLSRRQPVEELLRAESTPIELRQRLEEIELLRDFASDRLSLPENGSYRCYADLERPYVVWNVVAADEFSLSPRTWCFPIAGCVSYRGYYSEEQANAFAETLRQKGADVYLYGVPAYSTLGWFDDPLLNTFVEAPLTSVAGTIFHELAHQQFYVKDDSAFNEAFAQVVEETGVRLWLQETEGAAGVIRWEKKRQRQEEMAVLLDATREELMTLYTSGQAPEILRQRKEEILTALRATLATFRPQGTGARAFDLWLARPFNNARFVSSATYRELVPPLRQLLQQAEGDLTIFYREVEKLGDLGMLERRAHLAVIARPAESS